MGRDDAFGLARGFVLMAVDKLVDSTQLDSDLTSVANAIRTKGGTSAQLAFPADFVSAIAAIPTGSAYDIDDLINGSLTSIASDVTAVKTTLKACANLLTASFPNAASLPADAFNGCKKLTSVYAPSLSGAIPQAAFRDCQVLSTIDLAAGVSSLGMTSLYNCYALTALVLRRTAGVVTMANTTVFSGTPLTGRGGTYSGHVYVPSALLASYKADSNWSVLYANYPGIFETIEGSIYE